MRHSVHRGGVGGWLPSMHHWLHDQGDMHQVGGAGGLYPGGLYPGGLHPREVCIQDTMEYGQLLECIFHAAIHLLQSPKIHRANLYKDLNVSDLQTNASLAQLVKPWTLKQVIISCIRLSPTGDNFFLLLLNPLMPILPFCQLYINCEKLK